MFSPWLGHTRLLRINYTPSSLKNGTLWQLELLELEPGVSSAEVKAESERDQLKLPLKPRRKHPGRQELPANLPRVEKIIACTPEQCVCGNCGKENSVIGYEKSEQLDVKPAEYFVVVTKREKRACKACEEQGVECAPVPARIIEKGLASDRVMIDTVVSKYQQEARTRPPSQVEEALTAWIFPFRAARRLETGEPFGIWDRPLWSNSSKTRLAAPRAHTSSPQ